MKNIRKNIYELTNGRCSYCGCILDINNFHIDHIVPKSKGGKSINNKVPSCSICNIAKSNLDIESFRKKIENLVNIDNGKIALLKKYWKIKHKKIKFYFEEMKNGK